MIAVARAKERSAQFPEEELKAALKDWWSKEALERSEDPFAPAPQKISTIYDLLPALDSLAIMNSFLIVGKILGMEIPVGLVKPGGYYSQEEMMGDLLPKIRKHYQKIQT
jgi:hypothetical protein